MKTAVIPRVLPDTSKTMATSCVKPLTAKKPTNESLESARTDRSTSFPWPAMSFFTPPPFMSLPSPPETAAIPGPPRSSTSSGDGCFGTGTFVVWAHHGRRSCEGGW